MKKNITAHVLVKNEENFIWFALKSVINFVDTVLVYDTGSTDKTVAIIKSIKSSKIFLKEVGPKTPSELVDLRNNQIKKTKTEWFLLLDGDEVWPENSIKKIVQKIRRMERNKVGIVVKSVNCIGDVYHRLPQKRGEYKLLGKKGHFNLRAYKKSSDYFWKGTYPLEGYFDQKAKVFLNDQDEKLEFLDVSYWHLTHLRRSSKNSHKGVKYDLGVKIPQKSLPQVFFEKPPTIVPNPLKKISPEYPLIVTFFSVLRRLKNIFQ